MGTPANIVAKTSEGRWGVTYVNYDGYLNSAGLMLHDHYTDQAKVDALLALGHLSSLGETLDPKDTESYSRDRGEEDVDTDYFESFQEAWSYAKESHGHHLYAWDGQAWHYNGKTIPLALEE